jgi:hypothetical protein
VFSSPESAAAFGNHSIPVKLVPGRLYNHFPPIKFGTQQSEIHVLHFKGRLKVCMWYYLGMIRNQTPLPRAPRPHTVKEIRRARRRCVRAACSSAAGTRKS